MTNFGPKPPGSGRKKGVPNKLNLNVLVTCQEVGLDPIRALIKLYTETHIPDLKFKILKELTEYVYAKRRSIEHSGEINNPYLEKTIEELESLVKKKLEDK